MVTEPPQVRFATCETRAVDTRLLTSPDADDGSMVGVRNAVGLGILQSEGGDSEVRDGLLGKLLPGFSVDVRLKGKSNEPPCFW